MTSAATNQSGPKQPAGRDDAAPAQQDQGLGADGAETDPDEPSVQDWIEAEQSRPDLPDETADGLDDLEEELRHQAEDQPLDTPGRLR